MFIQIVDVGNFYIQFGQNFLSGPVWFLISRRPKHCVIQFYNLCYPRTWYVHSLMLPLDTSQHPTSTTSIKYLFKAHESCSACSISYYLWPTTHDPWIMSNNSGRLKASFSSLSLTLKKLYLYYSLGKYLILLIGVSIWCTVCVHTVTIGVLFTFLTHPSLSEYRTFFWYCFHRLNFALISFYLKINLYRL